MPPQQINAACGAELRPGHTPIVFVGPLPPPLHGMSAMNARVVAALSARCRVSVLAVQPNQAIRGFRYHLSKSYSGLRALLSIPWARWNGGQILYGSVDQGYGGLWNIFFSIMARICGLSLYLHHHSYLYLDKRTWIMAAFVRAAGRKAVHVVLCEEMEKRCSDLYPHASRFLIAKNAIEPPSIQEARRRPGAPFTIGFLSNLSVPKGITEFIAIFEELRRRGLEIEGRIAGPAVEERAERLVRAACERHPAKLKWVGPVHGSAKEEFFAGIDLFIFPTRSESFGLVLLESLIRGVPVVAPRRGCICLFDDIKAASIVPLDADFEAKALDRIEELAVNAKLLQRLSEEARSQGAQLNRQNWETQEMLIKTLVSAAT